MPAAFVASSIYSSLLTRLLARWPQLKRSLFVASIIALGALAIEVILVTVLGAVRSRELLGPIFYVVHLALFLLSIPSLATLLVIIGWERVGWERWLSKWQVVASLCAVFALGVVLLQYFVTESLYGIDGTNGPFSDGGND